MWNMKSSSGNAWGWASRNIGKTRRSIADFNLYISAFIINLTLLVMWMFATLLVVLAIAQIRITTGDAMPELIAKTTEVTLGLFVNDDTLHAAAGRSRADLIGVLIAAAGAIVTAVFATIAWLVSKAESNRRARRSVVSSTPVYSSLGLDDVRLMAREFEDATSVTVFSGDFSWMADRNPQLPDFENMRKLVERLAKDEKIKLVSYREAKNVETSIGAAMFGKVDKLVSYNAKLKGLRASFVVKPFGKVLIYKVHADQNDMHICRVTDRTPDGKELLDQFHILVGTI